MMTGMKKMAGVAQKAQDDKTLLHLGRDHYVMTPKERSRPELLNAKRKSAFARDRETTVQEVNRLLKMHQEMANAMKKIRKMGGLGKLGALFGGGGAGGGGLGGLLGGMGGGGAAPPPSLPGLPGAGGGSAPFGLPPGFDKFMKK
jgi:signal recognition particle subunit SRP54